MTLKCSPSCVNHIAAGGGSVAKRGRRCSGIDGSVGRRPRPAVLSCWTVVVVAAVAIVFAETASVVAFRPDESSSSPVARERASNDLASQPQSAADRIDPPGRSPLRRRARGKPVSGRVSAEELYDAYSQIRSEYNEKAFEGDADGSGGGGGGGGGWNVVRETADGVQIAMMSHPSDPSCPYVRMSAVMPGSVEEVWDFLRLDNWERTMPKMDPFYEGLTVLGAYVHRNVDMVLARKRTKRILTFGKRDFTFVSVSDVPLDSGIWVSGTVSVETPRLPRERGYTRAFQDSVAFYEPLPPDPMSGEGRTRLTIVCRIDLNDSSEGGEGGAVPMWIYVRTIGISGAASIQSMRKQLVLDRDERRRQKRKGEKKKGKTKWTRKRHMQRAWDENVDGNKTPVCPLFPWLGTKKQIATAVPAAEEEEN